MTGTFWVLAFTLAPVLTAALAIVAWRRRRETPAARALAVALAGISGWSLAAALILSAVPPSVRELGFPLIFVTVNLTIGGFWAVSWLLADPGWRPRPLAVVLRCVEPLLMSVLSVLPATSDLLYGRTDLTAPPGEVHLQGGWLFAVHAVYGYGLILSALCRLARTARSGPPVVRRQAAVLVASAVPSVIGNVVVTLGMHGRGAIDLTPLYFVVTGLVMGWAILRLGLLDLVPVARHQVVETMKDAIVVTDAAGRVIDLNPAARQLLAALRGEDGPSPLGRPLGELAGPALMAAVLPRGRATDDRGHAVVEVAGSWLDVQSIPVASAGRRMGRLTVIRDVSESQQREAALRRLNQQLADQVRTIDQLRATLAEEALRDPLTGLHNRRHLDRALGGAVDCAAQQDHPVAVLVIDIDMFKTINDRFGHAVGDEVLIAVAGELRAGFRAEDTVARTGGEEFVVVLPGAGEAEALARAELIRARCAGLRHPVPGGTVTVTVSTGVSVGLAGGPGAGALLAGADLALYQAKAAGRDRVVSAGAVGPDVQDVLSRV